MLEELAQVARVGPDTLEVARRERVPERELTQLLSVRMDLVVELVVQVVEPVEPAVVQVVRPGQGVPVVVLAAQVVLPEEEPDRSVPDREEYSSYLVLSHQSARKGWLEPVLLVTRAVPKVRMADVAQAEVPPYSLAHWLESSALPSAYQWVEEVHWSLEQALMVWAELPASSPSH